MPAKTQLLASEKAEIVPSYQSGLKQIQIAGIYLIVAFICLFFTLFGKMWNFKVNCLEGAEKI